MAKPSDYLLNQLVDAVRRERGMDVGIFDEIRIQLETQARALEEEWAAKTQAIYGRRDLAIAQIQEQSQSEIKDLDEMMSALQSVNKTLIDKINTYVQKINTATPVLDFKPNTFETLGKASQASAPASAPAVSFTPVGAGDGNTVVGK